jgi:hypothetical protein
MVTAAVVGIRNGLGTHKVVVRNGKTGTFRVGVPVGAEGQFCSDFRGKSGLMSDISYRWYSFDGKGL